MQCDRSHCAVPFQRLQLERIRPDEDPTSILEESSGIALPLPLEEPRSLAI